MTHLWSFANSQIFHPCGGSAQSWKILAPQGLSLFPLSSQVARQVSAALRMQEQSFSRLAKCATFVALAHPDSHWVPHWAQYVKTSKSTSLDSSTFIVCLKKLATMLCCYSSGPLVFPPDGFSSEFQAPSWPSRRLVNPRLGGLERPKIRQFEKIQCWTQHTCMCFFAFCWFIPLPHLVEVLQVLFDVCIQLGHIVLGSWLVAPLGLWEWKSHLVRATYPYCCTLFYLLWDPGVEVKKKP